MEHISTEQEKKQTPQDTQQTKEENQGPPVGRRENPEQAIQLLQNPHIFHSQNSALLQRSIQTVQKSYGNQFLQQLLAQQSAGSKNQRNFTGNFSLQKKSLSKKNSLALKGTKLFQLLSPLSGQPKIIQRTPPGGDSGGGSGRPAPTSVPLTHQDMNWGELETMVDTARVASATTEEGGLDGLIAEQIHPAPIPLGHSDTLLNKCDEEINLTRRVRRQIEDDYPERARQLGSNIQTYNQGKNLIISDRSAMVGINTKMSALIAAVQLFQNSHRYSNSLFTSIKDRLGQNTLVEWAQNPFPDNMASQVDTQVTGQHLTGTSVSSSLGLNQQEGQDQGSQPPSDLASAAALVQEKITHMLGTTEQLKAGAALVESVLSRQFAGQQRRMAGRARSAKAAYGAFITILKGVGNIATGNWFTPVMDGLNLLVGAVADHQAALHEAKAAAAEDSALLSELEAGERLITSAQLHTEGYRIGLQRAYDNFRSVQNNMVTRMNTRRQQFQNLAQDAANASRDSDPAGVAGRIMLAGAVLEMVTTARGILSTMSRLQLTPENIATFWDSIQDHRENNPIQGLRYVMTMEESEGIIGAWTWVHPSEVNALQSNYDASLAAQAIANVFIERLAGAAQNALAGIRTISSDSQFNY